MPEPIPPNTGPVSPIETIIEDARNGRIFILVDHEERENEGDLIVPAQMATPEAINFMATHGRGIVCLSLTPERIEGLGLVALSPKHRTRMDTAFTLSIEAREGITTGTSVQDRARTIATAIDPATGPDDIVTPGHVFPLRSRPGGVLARAGHTEAAVDIARLAGLNPSAVICEILREDGSMARLPDLIPFAERHGLRIGTIADLIAYRLRHDRIVELIATHGWTSPSGREWQLKVYRDRIEDSEHVALVLGEVRPTELVRVHAISVLDDLLGMRSGLAGRIPAAVRRIESEGHGVIALVRDGNPHEITDRLSEAEEEVSESRTLRQYGTGAAILRELGVRAMILLTHSPPPKIAGIEGYGLRIAEVQRLQETPGHG